MPSMSEPPTSGSTSVTSTYAVWPTNSTSMAPPKSISAFGRPLANVATSPVLGSTRETLPAALSVTYNAPPGPTVLPEPPSRPETNWVGLGPADGGAAVAAPGAMTVESATATAVVASANNCLAVMCFSLGWGDRRGGRTRSSARPPRRRRLVADLSRVRLGVASGDGRADGRDRHAGDLAGGRPAGVGEATGATSDRADQRRLASGGGQCSRPRCGRIDLVAVGRDQDCREREAERVRSGELERRDVVGEAELAVVREVTASSDAARPGGEVDGGGRRAGAAHRAVGALCLSKRSCRG